MNRMGSRSGVLLISADNDDRRKETPKGRLQLGLQRKLKRIRSRVAINFISRLNSAVDDKDQPTQ